MGTLVTTLCCGMITLQTYGITVLCLPFNIFVATFVIMAMGLSVEFTCHLAAAISTNGAKSSGQESLYQVEEIAGAAEGTAEEYVVDNSAGGATDHAIKMQQHVGLAMRNCFPAVLEGSLSTFISVIPMAFHSVPFFRRYSFLCVSVMVAIGMLNGFVIMPAVISLLGNLRNKVQEWRNRPVGTPKRNLISP